MPNPPDKKRELGLRGDVRIKWDAGTGQFEEPVKPVTPDAPDGRLLQVFMYLDPKKIAANDKLAPKKNDDNNQEKIDKIKASPIKWYVKVPSEDHHDDYSYHSPPWDSSSGSGSSGGSSGSSSPPYGSNPFSGPDSNGQSTPGPDLRDPDGNDFGFFAKGEAPVSAITNAPTQQVQFGGAPPASPGLSQRFNVFEKIDGANPTALRTYRKPKGIADIEMEFLLRPSDLIPPGSSVEINVTLIPFPDLAPPTKVYRAAFKLDENYDLNWYQLKLPFYGFDRDQEYPITFAIERRNDVSPNDDAEVWVMETIFRGLR